MTDTTEPVAGTQPERWRHDPLYRDTLLAGCRNALRTGTFPWWLRSRHADIGDVLAAARATDPELAAAIVRRGELRDPLRASAARAWRTGDPSAVRLTVDWLLLGEQPRVVLRAASTFRDMVGELPDADRATAYHDVLAELRHRLPAGDGTTGQRSGGWVYLLADGGKAALRAQRPADAALLLDEAWRHRQHLPPDSLETARAEAHLATMYATAIGWLPVPAGTDPFTEVLDRLAVVRTGLDRHPDTPATVQTRLTIAISQAQAWYLRRRAGLVGYITEAELRMRTLTAAEADVWRRLRTLRPDVVERDYATLPVELRPTLARLLTDLGSAAEVAGAAELAERAGRDALALGELPHHQLDAQLGLARLARRLDDRLRRDQNLLRDIDSGLLDRLNSWQRHRIQRRLRGECAELARVLYREKKPIAAWFWQQQAKTWAEPSVAGPVVKPSVDPGPAAPPVAAEPNWLAHLLECLRTENVLGVILQLKQATEQDVPAADVLAGVTEAAAWQPAGRRSDPDRAWPGPAATLAELRLAALYLAVEFADGYAVHLGAQVCLRLAQDRTLPWRQRVAWARKAAAGSEATGRTSYAVNAWVELLGLALDVADAELVAECVAEIQQVIRRAFASATGAADLVDVADEMIGRSTRAAGLLAGHGHARAAFTLAAAATGALRRMITADPSVAEELELVEQRSRARDDDQDARLFALMRHRVLTGSDDSGWPEPDVVVAGPVVQLLDAGDRGCWALGRHGSAYWVRRLDVDTAGLRELRDTVWSQLRPTRRRAPVLAALHRTVVRPLLPHLAGADVSFLLHGDFAGLPLHAAYDGERYLIERCRVTYLPSLDGRVVAEFPPAALVAGWDPAIDAGTEAIELADRLAALGLAVTRPAKAALGRQALLDSTAGWGVVHLAAHGDFHAWPMSMRSRLRLSVRVSMTAGEWLRSSCRAAFVFLNACNVGRHAPHAGDLNGFPLAVQVRGAVASVSALAPVPSDPARAFARRFYACWPDGDTRTAFQASCVAAIDAGESVSGWAPYLHTGLPVRLPEN